MLTPFPKGSSRNDSLPRPKRVIQNINIHCICRMPDIYDVMMINCDVCNKWYNYSCVHIDKDDVSTNWICPLCK